jgi:Prophage antirepressor
MNNLMIFENKPVEIFEFNGQVLFNPYHCGECLDLSPEGVRKAITRMNEKQVIKLTNSKVTDSNFRKLHNTGENFLTESGVYKLIFKSKKAEAEKFQDWVTDEVLPSIRKTGSYNPKGITKDDVFNLIKSLPEDDLKNEVSRMILERFLPVERKQVVSVSNGLNLKALLDEFLQDETVILRQTEYGLAVSKEKLYDFFSFYGFGKTQALKELDNANLIFHGENYRTPQIRMPGINNPIRVVIVKE